VTWKSISDVKTKKILLLRYKFKYPRDEKISVSEKWQTLQYGALSVSLSSREALMVDNHNKWHDKSTNFLSIVNY